MSNRFQTARGKTITGEKIMRTIVFALAVFMAGCATKTVSYWEKPGASPQDFNIDRGQCNAQAFSVASGNLMQIAIVQNSCLQGKGWYIVEKEVPR
jgi:hypothetical protein